MTKQQAHKRAVSIRVDLEGNVGASTMDLIDEYVAMLRIAALGDDNAQQGSQEAQ
jgi:hypothetical protein